MRQITKCFDSKLAILYKEAVALETLTQRVKHHLSGGKKSKYNTIPCSVSRFHQGTMTLCVEDPVWATSLRYELPSLRDKLRQEGLHHLTSIRICMTPANKSALVKKKKREVTLSHQAKETIKQSAEFCSYEPLKEALMRLSEHQARASDKATSG